VTVYQYPDYQAHADMVAGMKSRIERMNKVLTRLEQEWDNTAIDAKSKNHDVTLSVDSKGRLMSLSLAEGCTVRYDHLGLENLINSTLKSAVTAVNAETAQIEREISEEASAE
jgi:DNA-binding protein YbaB